MEYNYESLLEQRFQTMCQALLGRDYPDLQSFPVGMPDGGRDAMSGSYAKKDFTVFQIKYARNPAKISDPAEWVIQALNGEMPKITWLIGRGLGKYILVTNMPGSSHRDTGAVDRVRTFMEANLTCASQCLWRDDLDRKLDNAYDVKLHYPSLLSGADAMRLMLEKACAGEDAERRKRALNSYIGDQYSQDRTVRFKQADLPASPLFRLFVDVPLKPSRGSTERDRNALREFNMATRRALRFLNRSDRLVGNRVTSVRAENDDEFDELIITDREGRYRAPDVGAASLLLMPYSLSKSSKIIIEGAPGQGKSTLVQYLAQVHRYRLLNRPPATERLSDIAAKSPLKLPFKLELRDVAQWLEGYDPWAPEPRVAHGKQRSLEAAMSAHIEKHSGGVTFDVGDFLMLLESVPVLIILDALDEVADLDQRRRVIEEVEECATRLYQQACDVYFIVTSRPTAIADSPGFSGVRFFKRCDLAAA